MFNISASSPVLVGGSRSLPASAPAGLACSAFVRSLLASGGVLSVGCSSGADAIALSAAVGSALFSQVRVFAAFSSSGAGSCAVSAVSVVQSAARSGVSVSWLAGGSLAVPLAGRLISRSLAALRSCQAAVFFAPGSGSLQVARAALRSGVPVLVACVGLSAAPVLAVAPSVVVFFGQSFWLFAPAIQGVLF